MMMINDGAQNGKIDETFADWWTTYGQLVRRSAQSIRSHHKYQLGNIKF